MAQFKVSSLNLGTRVRHSTIVEFDIKLDLSLLDPVSGQVQKPMIQKRAILLNVKPQLLGSIVQWYSDRDGDSRIELTEN